MQILCIYDISISEINCAVLYYLDMFHCYQTEKLSHNAVISHFLSSSQRVISIGYNLAQLCTVHINRTDIYWSLPYVLVLGTISTVQYTYLKNLNIQVVTCTLVPFHLLFLKI